jgi:hypothetical protein
MALPTENKDYGQRILQLGCKDGLDIWHLQTKLIGWGSGSETDDIGAANDPVRLTGKFDATLRDAVMRFQKAHRLPLTGIVDCAVYTAIDREVALHPVLISDLTCPCIRGANDGPIPCLCMDTHTDEGKCTGFGTKRLKAKFLLDDKKLADDTELKDEKLDVYDMYEYEGMDKAVLWAVRAIMHRTGLQSSAQFKAIKVVNGYRCWHDNYHHTDETRWRHRRSTFHFGHSIDFFVSDHCTQDKWKEDQDSCPQCNAIRTAAMAKCGFQLRWQEPGRASIAEGLKTARPPAAPFFMHVDAVRLHPRKDTGALDYTGDEIKEVFAETDLDAAKPLYPGALVSVSYPVALAAGVIDVWPPSSDTDPFTTTSVKIALDPTLTPSEDFFRNTETGPGGWFPLGLSRTWHGGIHLYADEGTPIHAIADGELVGCRAGADEEQPDGSSNFVLIKHTVKGDGAWKDKEFYSLYMHLDGEEAKSDSTIRWRKELFERSKDHVEAATPAPIFEVKVVDTKNRFSPKPGLAAGEARASTGSEVEAKAVDDSMPDGWKVFKLTDPAGHYFFTKRDKGPATMGAKQTALAGFAKGVIMGLEKPIPIAAGEIVGRIAKAATADPVRKLGAFFHLETFAGSELPVTDFTKVESTDIKKVADRKAVIAALSDDAAALIPKMPDGVAKPEDIQALFLNPPYFAKLRSAQVKMPSAWSVDWKQAFKDAKSLGFLSDADALGDAWNKYTWWKEVKAGKGSLPAEPKEVFHYHPIALILQLAFR